MHMDSYRQRAGVYKQENIQIFLGTVSDWTKKKLCGFVCSQAFIQVHIRLNSTSDFKEHLTCKMLSERLSSVA